MAQTKLDPHGPVVERPRDERPLWRRVLPFAIALSAVGLLALRLDLHAFVENMQKVNYPAFFAFCGVFLVLLLSADAVATSFVYRHTVCPISVRELFLIRGASYLPSMVNHHIGQAFLTWYVSRAYGAPLWRVAGATLLVYATTFASLFVFAGVALFFEHGSAPWLLPLLVLAAVAGVGYLAIIHWAPPFLATRQMLAPLFDIGVRGHLQALIMRLPHICVLFVGTWFPFFFFGVDIPAGAAFAYVPVLMVVAALPVTPQGVGTRDWFSLMVFSGFAAGAQADREAAVASATLSVAVGLSLFQAGLSLVLWRRAWRVLAERQTAQSSSELPSPT